jgi:hypothetical protein
MIRVFELNKVASRIAKSRQIAEVTVLHTVEEEDRNRQVKEPVKETTAVRVRYCLKTVRVVRATLGSL